jgi:hypothetical protein
LGGGNRTLITIKIVNAEDVSVYQEALEALESKLEYPLANGERFRISHGNDYSAFFSMIGKATFFLAFKENRLIGCLSTIQKNVSISGWKKKAVYFCDLKILPSEQGRGVANKIYKSALLWMLKSGILFRFPLVYFVAMQGNGGDFMQGLSSSWVSKAFRNVADLNIYFADRLALKELSQGSYKKNACVQLSSLGEKLSRFFSLSGVKDLTNTVNGSQISLQHILASRDFCENPENTLKDLAERADNDDHICFAIDSREIMSIASLDRVGVYPNGMAKIYCDCFTGIRVKKHTFWISTNEI